MKSTVLAEAIDRLQTIIANTDLGVWAAIKLRNQTEAVIGKRMSDGICSDSNGEKRLLEMVAPTSHVVMDVGANVGAWFDQMRELAPALRKVILVEPGKQASARLTEKYSRDPVVLHIDKAVSDFTGKATFYELEGASELSSLMRTTEELAGTNLAFEVEVTTIDQLCEDTGVCDIDFLKIDAEGADMKVIRGAQSALTKQLFKFIQFEYNYSWAAGGETLGGAIQFLNSCNYDVFLIKKEGLYDCSYQTVCEYFRYSNYVAVRKDTVKEIEQIILGPIIR